MAKKKAGRAKKKSKQIQVQRGEDEEVKSAPHSFVIQRGKVGRNVTALMNNMRRVMAPFTAESLKVHKKNTMKDFVNMAGPMNVSHMIMFTKSEKSVNMRIARLPRGPTLHFQINSYTTISDLSHHIRKHDVNDSHFKTHALLVMNNFAKEINHQKLTASMFQNMFPSINVNQVKLRTIKRIALVTYDDETEKIEFRHYHLRVVPLGVSKSVKKLQKKSLPKLDKYEDISQFLLNPGALSESEAELDGEHNSVELPQKMGGTGNTANDQSAIRLKEIGPRMTLTLVKIQDGMCAGDVLYHKFDTLTDEQKAEITKRRVEKKKLKAQRKAEQEARVKEKEKEAKRKEKKEGAEGEEEKSEGSKKNADNDSSDPESDEEEGLASDPEDDDDDMDDAAYYEQEVGAKPEKELFSSHQRAKRKENFDKKSSDGPPRKRKFEGKVADNTSKSPRGKSRTRGATSGGRKDARPDKRNFTGGAKASTRGKGFSKGKEREQGGGRGGRGGSRDGGRGGRGGSHDGARGGSRGRGRGKMGSRGRR